MHEDTKLCITVIVLVLIAATYGLVTNNMDHKQKMELEQQHYCLGISEDSIRYHFDEELNLQTEREVDGVPIDECLRMFS